MTVFTFTFIWLKCRYKTQTRKILLFYAGSVLDAKHFDTHADSNAGNNLGAYLNSVQGKYVTFNYLGYLYFFFNSLHCDTQRGK